VRFWRKPSAKADEKVDGPDPYEVLGARPDPLLMNPLVKEVHWFRQRKPT